MRFRFTRYAALGFGVAAAGYAAVVSWNRLRSEIAEVPDVTIRTVSH